MTPLNDKEQFHRLVVVLSSVILSVAFIGLLYVVLETPPANFKGVAALDVFLDARSQFFMFPFTIQCLMWVIFFIGLGELYIRVDRGIKEAQQLSLGILPEDDATMLQSKDLGPIYRSIKEEPDQRFYFLQRMVQRIILQFQAVQSVDQANSLMNSSLELMQHEVDLKYNMIRYITWLIPTLGFIGTVIGIALALTDASEMPSIQDSAAVAAWLSQITTSLSVAFYTTLVALLMSAVLVFITHIAQGREEMALNHAGQYCLDNLINRLYQN